MMEVVGTTGAMRCAELQSDHHNQQVNIPFFYKTDALPDTQPTVSEHCTLFYRHVHPKRTWESYNLFFDH